jgi:hypothetical protein
MATQRIRSGDIQVEGLAELSRALRKLEGAEWSKELRDANKSVADLVAKDARAAAYSLGGVAAHVAPSIGARASQQSAGVAFGGARYPMAGGAEFGSNRFKQFKPWRGNGSDAGYFVYPAIRQDLDRIETEYTRAIDALAKRAGLA